MKKGITISLAAMLLLAACGNNDQDRAISGAGIGAAGGALGSAVFGGSALTGAAVGAGVGAATGALTDEDDIDLGDPAWK